MAKKEPRLCVCEHCLCAIESREGHQRTLRLYAEEDYGEEYEAFITDSNGFIHTLCDWCEEPIYGSMYEIG